jgi:hypothetical protein
VKLKLPKNPFKAKKKATKKRKPKQPRKRNGQFKKK